MLDGTHVTEENNDLTLSLVNFYVNAILHSLIKYEQNKNKL